MKGAYMKKGTKITLGVVGGLIVLVGISRALGFGNSAKSEPSPVSTTTVSIVAADVPAHRTGNEIVGVSDKDISEINGTYYKEVRNDVTGNWRCLVIASNIDIKDYALSAYNTYIGDGKVLIVENLTTKTSTSISSLNTFLDVSVHEYIDGEEHDAKIMLGGEPLTQYFVYLDNGDVEKIDIE
jgi:hypothetical protein